MPRIAVLISGFGSNLQAVLDAVAGGRLPGVEVALIVSNRRGAYGIRRAVHHGVPVVYFPLAPYRRAGRPRQAYDADLAAIVRAFEATWVVLAGWMHVLSDAFLRHFPSRVVNLHPALPGMFPGTEAIARAYAAYRRGELDHTGVMVHLVPDEAVDAGPVVAQVEVPIHPEDTLEDLEARIHAAEHRLLVQALHDLLCRQM
ncbi:MAG: phosphoribosylglycinamide formyltransferase [Chloroflexi bacterium]|nr:MAG: phosphoribosylglycinamide formyltransferase [Chloroflexota bacterium]